MRIFLYLFLCLLFSGTAWPCSSHVSFDPHAGHDEGISSAGLINSPTASMLEKNHIAIAFTFNQRRYDALDARTAHNLHHRGHHVHGKNHEEYYHTTLGFGITDDFQMDLNVPVVSKKSIDIDSHSRLGSQDRATGLGDMRWGLKYRFWKKGIEAALISGIKLPSGRTSAQKENGDKFEIESQPGADSWDADFGWALSRRFKNRISFATSFQYLLRGRATAQHYGDVFRLSGGVAYALRSLGNHPNLSLVAELNQDWQRKDREPDGAKLNDGGGTTLWFSPGISADLTENVAAFFAMPIPLYQNIHGAHEETEYQILSGISIVI